MSISDPATFWVCVLAIAIASVIGLICTLYDSQEERDIHDLLCDQCRYNLRWRHR